jgi:hypothetical protein
VRTRALAGGVWVGGAAVKRRAASFSKPT